MSPLNKLLIENRGLGKFKAESNGDECTLYLYDVIVSDDVWGGVSAETFVKELANIDAGTIHLRINSPGGDVFAARAIEQALREHSAHIIAHVDGYAASAASYIALAADQVQISEGGFFMIHKAWTVAFGNSEDLLQTATLLEKIDGTLVKSYAKATGQETDQIEQWMSDETWFTAEECVEFGFADEIAQAPEKENQAHWNLAAYANAPESKQAAPAPVNKPEPDPEPEETPFNTDHLKRKLELATQAA